MVCHVSFWFVLLIWHARVDWTRNHLRNVMNALHTFNLEPASSFLVFRSFFRSIRMMINENPRLGHTWQDWKWDPTEIFQPTAGIVLYSSHSSLTCPFLQIFSSLSKMVFTKRYSPSVCILGISLVHCTIVSANIRTPGNCFVCYLLLASLETTST